MWQIASATGWSVDYILNKVNYQTLIMMLSDAPRYIRDGSLDLPVLRMSGAPRMKRME